MRISSFLAGLFCEANLDFLLQRVTLYWQKFDLSNFLRLIFCADCTSYFTYFSILAFDCNLPPAVFCQKMSILLLKTEKVTNGYKSVKKGYIFTKYNKSRRFCLCFKQEQNACAIIIVIFFCYYSPWTIYAGKVSIKGSTFIVLNKYTYRVVPATISGDIIVININKHPIEHSI